MRQITVWENLYMNLFSGWHTVFHKLSTDTNRKRFSKKINVSENVPFCEKQNCTFPWLVTTRATNRQFYSLRKRNGSICWIKPFSSHFFYIHLFCLQMLVRTWYVGQRFLQIATRFFTIFFKKSLCVLSI